MDWTADSRPISAKFSGPSTRPWSKRRCPNVFATFSTRSTAADSFSAALPEFRAVRATIRAPE
jgi:hypothetical protein